MMEKSVSEDEWAWFISRVRDTFIIGKLLNIEIISCMITV